MLTSGEVAKLLDAEGTICSCLFNDCGLPFPNVALGMTEPDYPKLLHEQFGGWLEIGKRKGNWSDMYSWRIASHRVEPVLIYALPELVIKKVQAEALLLMLTTMPGSGRRVTDKQRLLRWTLHYLVKGLNERGRGKLPAREQVNEVLESLRKDRSV